jgi:hypothetical protein
MTAFIVERSAYFGDVFLFHTMDDGIAHSALSQFKPSDYPINIAMASKKTREKRNTPLRFFSRAFNRAVRRAR